MLLVIDVGNTNSVFAVYEGETRRGQWRAATNVNSTADELGIWLYQLFRLNGLRPEDVQACIIASVVPACVFALRLLSHIYFRCTPIVVGEPGVELGMKVLTDHPEEVGSDRLVNAVAGYARYGGPLVIVDFGTATTFDVVDEEGNYHGGAIAPGVNLSLEALHGASAQLPRVAIGRPRRVIGKTTVQAMRSGIYLGHVGLVEGVVRRIMGEFGRPMKAIATGGLANLFADATDVLDGVDPDLTLRGLVIIHQRTLAARAESGE
ncbi:type III pantothenate kinase [Phaeovibrio sulfidiphilus]|uniref:Type III pantothenate kinase n=1 Tax=Phaeovibrio sulfidiphilus TaxID=1220600 RepID=A0A8J6YYW8_9PROT|nr:type III pantothenate kinase [Phaeovibrio sulfidiphilus]MBE1237073.1 type III pantothenate kinase [Phaeovibrio sulfidiphilus]